ncbi:MAG: hypothetical protein JXR91_02465 [Deltaproteobacteria bacterium]|nr:hypothetical protein [Deltaproteobacteria bacterium]
MTNSKISIFKIIIFSILSLFMIVFTLLFILSNLEWTRINIPNYPWKQGAVAFSYETPLSFALFSGFAAGLLTALYLFNLRVKRRDFDINIMIKENERLKKELQNTSQLIKISNTGNKNIIKTDNNDLKEQETV